MFTQGPVDVLDHSCSVMAFGGKIGIDATKKMKEERPDSTPSLIQKKLESIAHIFSSLDGVVAINDSLLEKGISLIFLFLEKTKKNQVRDLSKELFRIEEFKNIKVAIFLDHSVEVNDIADAVWRFSNNVDPKRDHFVIEAGSENEVSHIAFDGTRKTKEFDGFDREWPNILASDEKTIQRVDEIWNKLGLGDFITSPSLKYRKQLIGNGAVVND
jgi:4-hydroxy-3-polyprenylbenzoate decarboxylase